MLMFILTDPAIDQITGSSLENECKYLFEILYIQYTKNRIDFLEMIKDDETYRFVFEEDLMYLPKEYYVIS